MQTNIPPVNVPLLGVRGNETNRKRTGDYDYKRVLHGKFIVLEDSFLYGKYKAKTEGVAL